MADILLDPPYWNWWLLGIVFMVIEILAPGVFFLWMGVAALCVGLVLTAVPDLDWQYQWLIFAVLSVGSIVGWWLYLKRHPTRSDQPLLNRRGEQYIGRVYTLDGPIVNGQGRLRVDDSTWKIGGRDCPAGTRVRVTGVEGVQLIVQIEQP